MVGDYHIERDHVLGSGGNATVYLAVHKSSGEQFAAKEIRLINEERDRLMDEIRIWSNIPPHVNILDLQHHQVENNTLWIVMGKCTMGLKTYLEKQQSSDTVKMDIMKQILSGINHLHTMDKPIAHRDINFDNTMVLTSDETIQVKLIDFGISRQANERGYLKTNRACVTFHYASPELCKIRSSIGHAGGASDGAWYDFDLKVDIFSAGLMFASFIDQSKGVKEPTVSISVKNNQNLPVGLALYQAHGEGNQKVAEALRSPIVPIDDDEPFWKQQVKLLIRRMISYKPEDRPTAQQAFDELTVLEGIIGDYRIDKEQVLGSGGNGTVYLATHTETNKQYAAKEIPLASDVTERLMDEIEIWKNIPKHDNILELQYYEIKNGFLWIVMEKCDMDLKEFFEITSVSNTTKMNIMKQILTGIKHLHTMDRAIAHRDINLNNIMVRRNNGDIVVKLIDFGISRQANQRGHFKTNRAGLTPYFASPELWKIRFRIWEVGGATDYSWHNFDLKVDIFSAGLVFSIFIDESTGVKEPKVNIHDNDPSTDLPVGLALYQAHCKDYQKVAKALRSPIVPISHDEPFWKQQVKLLIRRMISYKPENRPTAQQALDEIRIIQDLHQALCEPYPLRVQGWTKASEKYGALIEYPDPVEAQSGTESEDGSASDEEDEVETQTFDFDSIHQLKLFDCFKHIEGLKSAQSTIIKHETVKDILGNKLHGFVVTDDNTFSGFVKIALRHSNLICNVDSSAPLTSAADLALQKIVASAQPDAEAQQFKTQFCSHFVTGKAEMCAAFEWVILHRPELSSKKIASLREEILKAIGKLSSELVASPEGEMYAAQSILKKVGSRKEQDHDISSFYVRITNYCGWKKETFKEWTARSKKEIDTNQLIPYVSKDLQIIPVWIMSCIDKDQSRPRSTYASILLEQLRMRSYKARNCEFKMLSNENFEFHPLDVFYAVFLCCDPMLQQTLVKKMFDCKLAVPFLLPKDDSIYFTAWPLETIVLSWRADGPDGNTEQTALLMRHKWNIISFMRVGAVSASKSSLINGILYDNTVHRPFYDCEGFHSGNEKRLTSGMIEMAVFLPSGLDKDHFKTELLFLNLRGDSLTNKKQVKVLEEMSACVVVLVDVQYLKSHAVDVNTFVGSKTILILTHSSCPSADERHHCDGLVKNLTNLDITKTYSNKKKKSDKMIVEELIVLIQKKIEQTHVDDLNFGENVSKFGKKYNIPIDEEMIDKCMDFKHHVQKLLNVNVIDIDEFKKQILPYQNTNWHEIADQEKQIFKATQDKKATANTKDNIKSSISKLRREQTSIAKSTVINEIIMTLIHYRQNQDASLLFTQWIKIEMDALCHSILPNLRKKYQKLLEGLRCEKDSDAGKANEIRLRIQRLEEEISNSSLGFEHIFREFAQIYEANCYAEDLESGPVNELPELAARMFLKGIPLEIMDGDAACVPIKWIKSVMKNLSELINNKKLFVLAIVGIQSSGKSTLLNTMFGLEFAVSAGRCTRGIFAHLVNVSKEGSTPLPFDYVLLLDTEGLCSPERADKMYAHDNKLATLVIGLADLTIINMKGESSSEIQNLLHIAVYAFLRMKKADKTKRQQCMFVHQNVSDVNAKEKLMSVNYQLQEKLDKITEEAIKSEAEFQDQTSHKFDQVLAFQSDRDIRYVADLWQGDPPMAPINPEYTDKVKMIKQHVFERMSTKSQVLRVNDFTQRIEDMWNAVLADEFVFSFKNSLEIKAHTTLDKMVSKLKIEFEHNLDRHKRTLIYVNIHHCEELNLLEEKTSSALGEIKEKIDQCVRKQESQLTEFFEKSDHCDILHAYRDACLQLLKVQADNAKQKFEFEIRYESTEQEKAIKHLANLSKHEERMYEEAVKYASAKGSSRGKTEMSEDEKSAMFEAAWMDLIEQRPKNISTDVVRNKMERVVSMHCLDKHVDLAYIIPYLRGQTPLSGQTVKSEDIMDCDINKYDSKDAVSHQINEILKTCDTLQIINTSDSHVLKDKEYFYNKCEMYVRSVIRHLNCKDTLFMLSDRCKCKIIAHLVHLFVKFFHMSNFGVENFPMPDDIRYDLRQKLVEFFNSQGGREKWLAEYIHLYDENKHPHAKLQGSIQTSDIDFDCAYRIPKDEGNKRFDKAPLTSDDIELIKEHINKLMQDIDEEIDEITSHDAAYSKAYVARLLRKTFSIFQNNHLSFETFVLVISWAGIAKFTVLAVRHALTKFEMMEVKYRLRHGYIAKLEAHKMRIKRHYILKLSTSEGQIPLVDLLYNEVKCVMVHEIRLRMRSNTIEKLMFDLDHSKLGQLKMIYKNLAEKREFKEYEKYLYQPYQYAGHWMKEYVDKLIHSFYIERATQLAEILMVHVKKSVDDATALSRSDRNQGDWYSYFKMYLARECQDTIHEQTRVEEGLILQSSFPEIQDIDNFVRLVLHRFSDIEDSLKQMIKSTENTEETWCLEEPHIKVMKELWKCKKSCPFCSEPCINNMDLTSRNHRHMCYQHKPLGLMGDKNHGVLASDICSDLICTESIYNCKSKDCKCKQNIKERLRSLFRKHKYCNFSSNFPDWEIYRDHNSVSNKYWKWVWCTFQDDIKTCHKGVKDVHVPQSWKSITLEDALESLETIG